MIPVQDSYVNYKIRRNGKQTPTFNTGPSSNSRKRSYAYLESGFLENGYYASLVIIVFVIQ